jgi:hypothetical protein
LISEFTTVDRAASLYQAIGQRRLAVVDVRDDAEIANAIHDKVAWLEGGVCLGLKRA